MHLERGMLMFPVEVKEIFPGAFQSDLLVLHKTGSRCSGETRRMPDLTRGLVI